VAKSLTSALLELSAWLDDADTILASHCIGGEPEAVVDRINKHKVCFICFYLVFLPFSSVCMLLVCHREIQPVQIWLQPF